METKQELTAEEVVHPVKQDPSVLLIVIVMVVLVLMVRVVLLSVRVMLIASQVIA